MDEKNLAINAIRKKLIGQKLSYKEIYAIMDEISQHKLGDILTTYFVASGYSEGFSDEELYYLTRAMVETGDHLQFKGIVADKHSIGGVPGTRVTLILVPIIAAAGFKIPKSSSRAITTPAGTADAMEVFAKVTLTKEEIYDVVGKTNACIVWGGSFKIAPADDDIIKIEEPLRFESYDKIVVSVMAKKVAFGATHVVIDLPYGATLKIHKEEEAQVLQKKFQYLGKRFGIKTKAYIHKMEEPASRGIGPLLEAREALKVLEQKDSRSKILEDLAVEESSELLSLCLESADADTKNEFKKNYKSTSEWASSILISGRALEKFKQIIKAQGGNADISSGLMRPGKYAHIVKSEKVGKVKKIYNNNLTAIAKILGAPVDHRAGLFLYKMLHDKIERDEEIFTIYSESEYRLKEGIDSLSHFPIFEIER